MATFVLIFACYQTVIHLGSKLQIDRMMLILLARNSLFLNILAHIRFPNRSVVIKCNFPY